MRKRKFVDDACEIITMPAPTVLSDEDLHNLVVGLIRMVKRFATVEQIERLILKIGESKE